MFNFADSKNLSPRSSARGRNHLREESPHLFWEIFNLAAGALIGGVTSWIFERRATKDGQARHAETLKQNEYLLHSNEQLQNRIVELEQSQHELQGRMYEGFASSARPSESVARSARAVLDAQAVLNEIRARLDVNGQTSLGTLRSVFLGQGHSSQSFNDIIDELIRTGVVRREGKVLEFI